MKDMREEFDLESDGDSESSKQDEHGGAHDEEADLATYDAHLGFGGLEATTDSESDDLDEKTYQEKKAYHVDVVNGLYYEENDNGHDSEQYAASADAGSGCDDPDSAACNKARSETTPDVSNGWRLLVACLATAAAGLFGCGMLCGALITKAADRRIANLGINGADGGENHVAEILDVVNFDAGDIDESNRDAEIRGVANFDAGDIDESNDGDGKGDSSGDDDGATVESTVANRVAETGRAEKKRRNQRLNRGELAYPRLADLADLDNCVDHGKNFAASCIHVVLDTKGSNQYKDRYTCVNCRRIWSMDTEYNKLRKATKQAAPTTSRHSSWHCDPDWR